MSQTVEANLNLIAKAAKSIWNKVAHIRPQIFYDDLYQEGYFGLVDAVQKFDPSHGYPFKKYALWRIYWTIIDYLRNSDHLSRTLRKRTNIALLFLPLHEEDGFLLNQFYYDPNNLEIREQIDFLASKLKDKEKEVFLSLSKGKSQDEIAKEMQVSQSYISLLKKNVFRKLQKVKI